MATQLKYLITSIHGISATASILLALTTVVAAAAPASLTTAKLEDLSRLAAPISKQIKHHRQQAQQAVDKDAQRSAAADATMRPFLADIGQDTLLAQNNTTTLAPSAPPATTPAKPSRPDKSTSKKDTATTIKVECDGGFYFDSETGVLAYLKNIRLTDSDARFKLRCSDELKVLLEKQTEEPNKKTDAKKPGKQPGNDQEEAPQKKDKSFAEFGKLKLIIASGNVRIAGKNNKGQPFIASGNIASYNALSGEMILKGGRPTLQQSANQYFQAQEPGQWIRILMKDKHIHSIITSKGKWVMQATTKQTAP